MGEGEPVHEPFLPPPSPEDAERTRRVVALLGRAADGSGFLPFDRFMEIALYTPEVGYYDRPRSPLGPSGDFYTAAHVHPMFGRTLADRVRAVRTALGPARPFHLVEIGPGDGTLTATVVEALGATDLPRIDTEIVLVERSPSRGATAFETVRAPAEKAGVPVRLVASVGEIGPFEGVVLANELFDAQPVRRLRWSDGRWHELGVRIQDPVVLAAETEAVPPVPPPALPDAQEPGTIVEVSPRAQLLVREVADHLVRGEFLVLDYGMEEAELLRGHPDGTLAAVRGHRTGLDPLAAPGSTDLSTFVNFTRLRDAARRAGLEILTDRTQAEALEAWGLRARLDEAVRAAGSADAEVRVRLAVKNLLFGFERFRVLEFAAPSSSGALRSLGD